MDIDGIEARLLTDIGILEDKPRAELVFEPVHLATYYTEQRFAVNEDFDSILLDCLVK